MKAKSVLTTFLILLFISFSGVKPALAQSVPTNYADVKVDELSDAQIRQLMERAASIGYSDAQLEQLAAAQGMKAEEIQKLRFRVEKIRAEGGSGSTERAPATVKSPSRERTYLNGNDTSRWANNQLQRPRQQLDANNLQRENLLDRLMPKVFGAALFSNSNLTFEPNLRMATPKSYIVGPDDELLIDLSGDNEASYNLKVSPEGAINLQYVGRISVGGLTIEQATSKIRSAMSASYPGLRSGRTQVSINLGNIRSIRVTILGEVIRPGSYTLPSLATVFNVLYASGGPNENGSFRKIQVLRNNRVVSTIDIYDFLLKGVQTNNIRLQDQDVINVPVYLNRVSLTGEVKRPALFEVLPSETLADVLRFGGGFSKRAYTAQIKVLQNTNKERRLVDIEEQEFATYQPKNGDEYRVEAILDRFENRVEINGAVFRPGSYELEKGLTLKGLLAKAEGLREDAFLNRGYISRLNADLSLSLLSFDVDQIQQGSAADIPLQREDKVTISSIFDLREEYKVTIQGEVRQPGTFKYAENMSLEALIQMAGGLNEGASPSRIEISRRIKNSDITSASAQTADVFTVSVDKNLKIQDKSFQLQPFDIVSIRNSEGYQIQKQVRVEGEVLFPGIYTISRKDERISDLVTRAGGLSPLAYVQGASLRRTGGHEIKTRDSLQRMEEERAKLMNLNRLKESGARDTMSFEKNAQIWRSDLVGINLERILKNPVSREDLILDDGDIIRIPRQLQTVRITGEVLQPNSIVYNKGKSFKNYINGAGGYSYNAYKKGVYIVYSNGSVAAAKKFLLFNNYPEVKPGAEIFVPKRADREKLTIQGWIGIGTAAASLAAIVVSLLR
ncbi:SLBB domain-containing protein [Pedobacter sp.]|uniref:SLBB domain-containing protein n=1 Tax=Pedobacter sp. TaxID=1411316 RepID=UPI003D7F94E6